MAPPKKEAAAASAISDVCIKGFDYKETKILAAAFLSQISHDKYDFDVMAVLAGNTAGTLKKYLPKTKTKAIEKVPAFGAFINGTSGGDAGKAAPAKAAANKGIKRKAEKDADADDDDIKTADIKAEGSNEGAPVTEDKDEAAKKVLGKDKGRGKKAASQEGKASAEVNGEENLKPKTKPRGKKAKPDDEEKDNGGGAEEEKEPALKKPRGKAAAKKAKTEEKADADELAKEKKKD